MLGDGYYVVEEGLGGRDTVFDDPLDGERNGYTGLFYTLKTHKPIDILVISLGTNDTKTTYHATPQVIALGLERLVLAVERFGWDEYYPAPKILIISPVHVGEKVEQSKFVMFDRESSEKSKKLAPLFQSVAQRHGATFLDAALYAEPSECDQLHMEKESHLRLAAQVAKVVEGM